MKNIIAIGQTEQEKIYFNLERNRLLLSYKRDAKVLNPRHLVAIILISTPIIRVLDLMYRNIANQFINLMLLSVGIICISYYGVYSLERKMKNTNFHDYYFSKEETSRMIERELLNSKRALKIKICFVVLTVVMALLFVINSNFAFLIFSWAFYLCLAILFQEKTLKRIKILKSIKHECSI
ncbi:hypothetical protein IGI42_002028 [Enterococcus sp. AZ109]